jgi:phosphatidate cytidylyltransferase
MTPILSPKKSWEGGASGLVCGTLFALIWWLFGQTQLSLGLALLGGVVLSCVGMLGDLVESLMKRDAGVKDSNQIPGLGGALDVLDSLLFTFPVTYALLRALHG